MRKYLDELADGEAFTMELILAEKSSAVSTKGGQKMVVLEVADKTKMIKARFFGNDSECDKFFNMMEIEKVYRFSGVYKRQYNSFVISKDDIELVTNPNPDDFEPSVEINQEQSDKLFQYINRIKNHHVKRLLELTFEDKELLRKFLTHPAAVIHHHAFPRGLITHVLEMLEIAVSISSTYYKIDRDLLFCGCILHDIGKTDELKVEFGTKYSDEGQLLSHIPMAHALISKRIAEIEDFPAELANKILHMILSHHGRSTWDKPSMMEPKTLEAVVLHHIDMLSAKISPIHDFVGEYEGWQKISNSHYFMPPLKED